MNTVDWGIWTCAISYQRFSESPTGNVAVGWRSEKFKTMADRTVNLNLGNVMD